MAFFLGEMNSKFVQFSRLNITFFAAKFLREINKINAEKYRREISLKNIFFFLLFLCKIDSLLFAFFSEKREICLFFLYADCMCV